ncbi:hypothetical protein NAV33_21360 [Pseudomonas stutzeri]|uniref:hypothetical protein n=1 Tax=Stutzerimonas stutzeri TaxID=316 RepID=UPI0021090619|nr:hypothetical protein [Stutzerimonas stutzeri]MCQ4314415.1 hypothetical protein [Stutzerimonas stutzeri]
MFKKLFAKKKPDARKEEDLVPTPIPALIIILLNKEREKGSPLTEAEVTGIRDNAVCMMLPASVKMQMEESRGYPDLNPEYAWEQWQTARLEFSEGS